MREEDIRKYARLMAELELTGLEITEDDKVVRLERNLFPVGGQPQSPAVPVPREKPEKDGGEDWISIRSPLVGLFYAAPAENADPYVALGDQVRRGQTLCIVEAMKLMNEISAEEDGTIVQVCVTNGQMVDYGTELFRIRRQQP